MRSKTIASALVLTAVVANPTLVLGQVDPVATDSATAVDRDDNGEWGWLGLLGLAGLLGLRRRERDDVVVRRSA
jgi:MYXO-CTERM domain-containing protein